eukprot:CAMPEP_0178763342 /NCGR_PEP_ID=MMETSP0744-20121128/17098_1 /TAXON_ID=913974 /ORGANISM="Nitzschia punctata, Strain CCMP561" /LENGTH=63 /DNA_ID=CAMNT_0020418227 /DNA_START=33 /DNA_END=224 /DNA_ORIENTATION=+
MMAILRVYNDALAPFFAATGWEVGLGLVVVDNPLDEGSNFQTSNDIDLLQGLQEDKGSRKGST